MSSKEIFKIIHTSDWHLGKKLFKAIREEEHQAFLDWLYQYIQQNDINLLIIAGDIFDVPGPPYSAQKMLYNLVHKMGKIKNFQTVIITGNHDSPALFEVPKAFFEEHNCHVYTRLEKDLTRLEHIISFQDQKIALKLLPYFRNYELLNQLEQRGLKNDPSGLKVFFNDFFSSWTQESLDHKILVAHHSFGDFMATGSEHAIHLSGLSHFPLEWVLPHFDYVALGHIHKKQKLTSKKPVLYSGSPLPLRFNESNNKNIIEIDLTKKSLTYKEVNIPLIKSLIQIKTNTDFFIEDIKSFLATIDDNHYYYLEVQMEFTQAASGIADHVRSLIKNHPVELLSFIPTLTQTNEKKLSYGQINELNIQELFENYYQYKYDGKEVPSDLKKSFQELLDEVHRENS
ncbi:MAG: exonuclease SbcCD subunit D [Bacteriovoracaceae bacterium]|jgi:exonuclease SbcD|nr:hypothetical protein [Halobacteriovoraceae bacterium]MDP7320002.1 exonuclease SbcCD subunit D [Bacteriovoracaceae bacterium]|tara:strand:+ start:318 stop:1517 length:1200 start_codon:yes stop_codon:yes gene_type:complete